VSTGEIHPLSPAQQQLWFVDRLRGGAAIEYLLSGTLRIRGALDLGALTAALAHVAQRHAVLRSRFREIDGAAVRLVVPGTALPLSEVDLSDADDPAALLHELRTRDLRTPINLCEQPPWRLTLARMAADEWVLMVVAHHIAFDGMSWSVLARELEALYGAFTTGEPARLAPLPAPRAEAAVQPADLAFWRDQLAGLPTLTLPADRARPAEWDADGDHADLRVPADLVRTLRSIGGRAGVTPFTVYLAAFELLLARYADQDDIGVGVSVSTRTPDDLDRIGMFLNTVVLRVRLADDETFGELLRRVAATTIDAVAHRHVPFDEVVAELAPERDLSRNPVFQAAIAWYDARRSGFRLPGLDVELVPPRWASSAFDLSLHLAQQPDGSVNGQLAFPTSLFDRDRIERMTANFLHLLSDIADRPDAVLSDLAVVAEPELRVLREWGTGPDEPDGRPVPELFADRVRATPDALAVVTDDGSLSYAELAARVGGLAGALCAHGVTTETRVGVALDRSADLVVAVLAVLCAGGTVVPLPVDHPYERVAFVVHEAGVALVLGAPVGTVPTLPVAEWPETGPLPVADIRGAQLAYILYTSGSTGRPKGVAVTHEGIGNRVRWSARHQLRPADRVLLKTTTAFDAAMWELLAPAAAGASIVVAPTDAHRDPSVLVAAIARHDATVLQLVPSVLRLVVDEPGLAACTSLRLVCSAGEALPAPLCATLTSILDVTIDNTYGPTEFAIDATAHRYTSTSTGHVPIGRPLSRTRVSVVDGQDRLVPIGVPGELCLTGAGLARGYVGRPELTADRFTPDPAAPGARRYHTGDVVRWRADGTLEFLGRADDQLKINGVRVEPAEVEVVLSGHPAVAVATVVVRRTPAGGPVLAAYAVPAPCATPAVAELLDHLVGHLPAPLVPASITLLDAMPLGPTGKVDRDALPDPAPARPAPEGHVAPAGPVEAAVAETMAELLGVPVGATDDFFALGGHSLLAIRLVLALRRRFEGELTIGELFVDRTARNVAARIAVTTEGTAIRPVARHGALPVSFAQQRLWFLDRLDPGSVEYLIPIAMRLRGEFDPAAFRRAVDEVCRLHEVLRTRYVERDGEPTQIVDPPAPAAFELVDLTGRTDAEETGRAIIDTASSRPFDLAVEHSLRATVVRLRPDDHLVALTLHHIAFDAWSMDIFFRALDDAYRGATGAAPAVQYPDFASWQRDQDLGGHLDYWIGRLAGLRPVELVTDRPRAAERDPRGATLAVSVPPEVGAAVAALASRHGTTPFMVLLAVFQVLLVRYTGQSDIAVGTPVAGRTRQETENLVGLFTNTLILRTDLAGDPTFTELLGRVRTTCVDAFANQDLPFEHLVDALRPERDLSRNPLFQIMFEVAHLEDLPTEVCGAAVEYLRAGTPVAKFDLTLSVQQRADGNLRCVFEYATALFDEATIARMADHYLRLMAGVTADPAARSGSYPLNGAADLDRILVDWPDPDGHRVSELDPPERHDRTVAELFESRATSQPDAIAVVQGDRRITYAELNARANRFARVLLAHGARPETVVACCLERDAAAIVVLLATLKVGAVYAPFDPQHPAERLAFMLDDAGARIVVTAPELTDTFAGRVVLTVDDSTVDDSGSDQVNLGIAVARDQLAYIIYTSGSTGRPKGVMIEHRSYAHHCQVIADAYDIGRDDRVVLLSALTFDVAMDQIGATLVVGATIVVADPATWTPPDLPARIAEHGVTIMEITPAYYRECLRYGSDQLRSLRLMNVGGDVVTVADARAWAATGLPGRFLCNYGPTEATVTCMLFPVGPGGLDGARDAAALSIGRGVAGTRVYVVDADLRPVPVGVPGELCLGGVRLARGYLGRPELTARSFVPDPFGGPGSRLYRTGDLVRWRPDGTVEFLGRIDNQVKVRGLRIELGEIEAALLRQPGVEAAVVVAAGDRLAAYMVGVPGVSPEPGELRAGLREFLPEYMVPSFWTALPALPMTASGKIDRGALPAPAPLVADQSVGPRTEAERIVAGIWCAVLDRESVGADDDFFALGGHSLLATRVRAQLRTAFGVDLPLRRLFEATTVAAVADAVSQALEDDIAALTDAEVAALLATDSRS
jgi:amino acid adenylation domain-containing protein